MASTEVAQYYELLEAFQLFDKDGNGEISISELPSVLRYLGQNPTDRDLDIIMKEMDSDGSGTLDYEEYEKLVRKVTVSPDLLKTELRQAFQVLDREKSGVLQKRQLADWLTSIGEPLSKEDTQAILNEADTNGDGIIDCEVCVVLRGCCGHCGRNGGRSGYGGRMDYGGRNGCRNRNSGRSGYGSS
ncbi:neo-calmodulin-like [Babylonia areolata]|uniref:neo-calmodulin-like n=1 Tax=Babylonia areolata TaxID=304850 RepID=UPI003FD0AE31